MNKMFFKILLILSLVLVFVSNLETEETDEYLTQQLTTQTTRRPTRLTTRRRIKRRKIKTTAPLVTTALTTVPSVGWVQTGVNVVKEGIKDAYNIAYGGVKSVISLPGKVWYIGKTSIGILWDFVWMIFSSEDTKNEIAFNRTSQIMADMGLPMKRGAHMTDPSKVKGKA